MSKLDAEESESTGVAPAEERSAAADTAVSAAALMNGRREIVILHAGARYRLRITANDKLILTK
ncbi:hemin uptake protein HemP [Methylobacterium sp. ID0610]|uniref:hemin uptake protein HemP n=1 Tax=Methylobacterium carpenticola TaxID=3344827 RepID=UPI0036D05891